jgi:hypothetical protein
VESSTDPFVLGIMQISELSAPVTEILFRPRPYLTVQLINTARRLTSPRQGYGGPPELQRRRKPARYPDR